MRILEGHHEWFRPRYFTSTNVTEYNFLSLSTTFLDISWGHFSELVICKIWAWWAYFGADHQFLEALAWYVISMCCVNRICTTDVSVSHHPWPYKSLLTDNHIPRKYRSYQSANQSGRSPLFGRLSHLLLKYKEYTFYSIVLIAIFYIANISTKQRRAKVPWETKVRNVQLEEEKRWCILCRF